MEIKASEMVWADEAGVQVRFELAPGGKVRVVILRDDLECGYVAATISNWRWDRVITKIRADKPVDEWTQTIRGEGEV